MSTNHRPARPAAEANARGDAPAASTGSDVLRQVVVLVGAFLAVAGAFLGSGALGGTPVAEAAGGALSAEATHLAPAGPAFSIWSVIYTGLVALAVWQALPARRSDERQRSTGWLVLASLVLNAAWIWTVQAAALILSVVVIVALLVVLLAVLVRLRRRPAQGLLESVVMDGTLGLYLGWVCVATVANIAAVLAAEGFTEPPGGPEAWAVVVLAVVAVIGIALARYGRGRLAVAAAIAWGLAWIAVGRSSGEPVSTPVAVAAAAAAAVVLVTTVAVRLRAARS